MANGQFCVVKVDVEASCSISMGLALILVLVISFLKFFRTFLHPVVPHLSGENCKLVTHKVKITQKSKPFLDFFKALSVCKTISGLINCNWKPQDFA